MGSSMAQTFKVIKEAEAYPGPSIVIAYAPCIAHGLKGGMSRTMQEEKDAVAAGYWQLFRYNPELAEEGKNPLVLDSKEPDWNKFQDFIKGEVRYSSLMKAFPEEAEELFVVAQKDAKWKYDNYKRLASLDYSK